MFVAVYEFDVKDGMEQAFIDAWLELTMGIYERYGSYGSRLQKDKSGVYIGYAQWPDRGTWVTDWSGDTALEPSRTAMRSCVVSVRTVYEAEVVADYLQTEQSLHDPCTTEEKQIMYKPKPGPGHLKLELLAGSWRGEEIMHPSQWDPEGGIAQGQRMNRLDLNGFALISDYEQERDGAVTYTGHGVYSFNPKSELYTLHWFDGMGSLPEIFTGQFNGDVLTLAHGGPGMHARSTCDLSQAGQMRIKMEMSGDGSDWKTLYEATYSKR